MGQSQMSSIEDAARDMPLTVMMKNEHRVAEKIYKQKNQNNKDLKSKFAKLKEQNLAMELAEKQKDNQRTIKIHQVSYQVVPDEHDPFLKIFVILKDDDNFEADLRRRDKNLGQGDQRRKKARDNEESTQQFDLRPQDENGNMRLKRVKKW